MFLDNASYIKSLDVFAESIDWDRLNYKKILIVGATGLIGTFLIDLIMRVNKIRKLHIFVIAMGRNKSNIEFRFSCYFDNPCFSSVPADINQPLVLDEKVDFIIHLASNTHPVAYAEHPVETLMTNVEGTYHLLSYAVNHMTERFLFLSSVEIYGQTTNNEPLKETDCGYIDCNTVRACYNEGKRAGESLCQAFIKQYNLDIVIPRLCRIYGPTMKIDDSKALSQFLKKGLQKENIVLKSKGNQYFSYLYVGDTVNALLHLLLNGKKGEAYNVADAASDIHLKDLAEYIASWAGKIVVFDTPEKKESAGYSKADYAILDSNKLCKTGWIAKYDIKRGINETLDILNIEKY